MNLSRTVESLNFQQPDRLAFAAAQLLVAAVDNKGNEDYVPNDEDMQEYLDDFSSNVATRYGLVEANSNLLAATVVIHNFQDTTHICSIASKEPGKGYGRELIRHVARQAMARGDARLTLCSLEHAFFEHLGFAVVKGKDMAARPQDVLNS